MTETRRYYPPLRIIIVFIFFNIVFGTFLFMSFFTGQIIFIIVFLICFIFYFTLTLFSLRSYSFNDEKIIIHTPLLKNKEILLDDITGFHYSISESDEGLVGYQSFLIIFTNKIKFRIAGIGKKLADEINNFSNQNYQRIKAKNIEELAENVKQPNQ